MSRSPAANRIRVLLLAAPLLAAATPRAFAVGMPQLDFANPLTKWQVVWGAVIFALLYFILSRSALPRVASVIEIRQGRIDGDLEAAQRAKAEADRAIEEVRRARRAASAEAQANLDRVVSEAREEAAKRARDMNARLEADLARAEQQIAAERERALGSLREIATDTAQLLVERVTGQPADRRIVETRVDGALSGSKPFASPALQPAPAAAAKDR
jgi:F-type H+-transporting ATPase subunit b